MAVQKTNIEWTEATWNPVAGCTKVSPGCAHCYAEALTLRFHRGGRYLPGESTVEPLPAQLEIPLKWKTPRRIFVNSMSDLFHEAITTDYIAQVFDVMQKAHWHTFQVLTKRHRRLAELALELPWPANVWIGVSVENQLWADERIPYLKQVPAAVRFLSVELILKPVDLTTHLDGLQWVIVGGESGPRARPMDVAWARQIRDQCISASVPFFFKQQGGRRGRGGGDKAILDGRLWREMPRTGARDMVSA